LQVHEFLLDPFACHIWERKNINDQIIISSRMNFEMDCLI
jgi:hypothetical protein